MCWYCHILGVNPTAPDHDSKQCANLHLNKDIFGTPDNKTPRAIYQQNKYVEECRMRYLQSRSPPCAEIEVREIHIHMPQQQRQMPMHVPQQSQYYVPSYCPPQPQTINLPLSNIRFQTGFLALHDNGDCTFF